MRPYLGSLCLINNSNMLLGVGSDISVWHWKSGCDRYGVLKSEPLVALPVQWIMGHLSRGPSVQDVSWWKMKGSLHSPLNRPWTHLSSVRAMFWGCVWTQFVYLTWAFKYPSPFFWDTNFICFLKAVRPWDFWRHFLAPCWQKCNQTPQSGLRMQYQQFIQYKPLLCHFHTVEE